MGWGQLQSGIAGQIEASLAPLREASAQITKSFIAFEGIAARVAESLAHLRIPAEFQRALEDTGRFQREVAVALARLPERTRTELSHLAGRGWYIDPELPATAPADLVDAIEEGQAQGVDDALAEYLAKSSSPSRKGCSDSILIALLSSPSHSRRMSAAITSCRFPSSWLRPMESARNVTDLHMFRRKDRKPELAAYVEAAMGIDTYRAALLSPLAAEHPISMSEAQRPPGFDGLNRHQILHGESLTYHTEMNSLKAVSLLSFLVGCFISTASRMEGTGPDGHGAIEASLLQVRGSPLGH